MARFGRGPLALAFVAASIAAAPALFAGPFSVVYNFDGFDAAGPQSPLVVDADGNFFGTSPFGGSQQAGSVFEMKAGGGLNSVTVLYSFSGGSDGAEPFAELTPDASGNLFGVATAGGASKNGTIFELERNGSAFSFTTAYTFTGGADGASPIGGLAIDGSGTIYGTTAGGGAGSGTIFALHRGGGSFTLQTLYTFSAVSSGINADGAAPEATLFLDPSGNLFGTAAAGGAAGEGVVFELAPGDSGWTYRLLHAFSGGADQGVPVAALAADAGGNLFGTASGGQGALGFGTVFELVDDGAWTFRTIYTFENGADGAVPVSALVVDHAGNLFGTASAGGDSAAGTIFVLGRAGDSFEFRTLHEFDSVLDGEEPSGGLVADANGVLYGTTELAGLFGWGTIFQLIPPPVADSVVRFTRPGEPVAIPLSAEDPNLSGAAFSFAIASGPAHGSLSGPSAGTVTYTPASGFVGSDTFSFTATDANGTSVPATVTIIVSAPETRRILPAPPPAAPARIAPRP